VNNSIDKVVSCPTEHKTKTKRVGWIQVWSTADERGRRSCSCIYSTKEEAEKHMAWSWNIARVEWEEEVE